MLQTKYVNQSKSCFEFLIQNLVKDTFEFFNQGLYDLIVFPRKMRLIFCLGVKRFGYHYQAVHGEAEKNI